jgi:hypothetical protein
MFGSFHMSQRKSDPVIPLARASLMSRLTKLVYSLQLPLSPGQRGTLQTPSAPHMPERMML